MKPLLFIVAVVVASILVSLQMSQQVTWFTYYSGGMVGLLVSGSVLEFWNRRKRKQEEAETKVKSRKSWKNLP